MSNINRGDLVEFTDKYYTDYPPKDTSVIRYGVAMENEQSDRTVKVALANGSWCIATHIHAYAWIGWIPEELEEVHAEINNYSLYDDGWADCDEY